MPQENMVRPPLVLFIGPPHHGKTEARKAFCKATGLQGASCSEAITAILAGHQGVSVEDIKKLDKETMRPKYIEFGNFLCGSIDELDLLKEDPPNPLCKTYYRAPSALVRILFHSGVRVIDGVRRKNELKEARERMAWLGIPTLTVWIEKPDGDVVEDNTEVTREDSDVVIMNDGTLEEFHEKVGMWVKTLSPQEPPSKDAKVELVEDPPA